MTDPAGDNERCDCVYGDEFIDDGVPHVYVTKMCAACTESSERIMDFLLGSIVADVETPDRSKADG